MQKTGRAGRKSLAPRQPFDPLGRGAATPFVRIAGDPLTVAALEPVSDEIEEGAILVAHFGSALSAVKAGADVRVLPGREVPRAGDSDRGSIGEFNLTECEILDLVGSGCAAFLQRPAMNGNDLGKVEQPQREVDEVDSEINQATAARKLGIVEPGVPRAVGIVASARMMSRIARIAAV